MSESDGNNGSTDSSEDRASDSARGNVGWVQVTVASGEIEAQQIRAFFDANDIPCRFQGESLRKTHGLTLDGLGAVMIHVPAEHAERAHELLARVEEGALELPADEEPEPEPESESESEAETKS